MTSLVATSNQITMATKFTVVKVVNVVLRTWHRQANAKNQTTQHALHRRYTLHMHACMMYIVHLQRQMREYFTQTDFL